MNHNIFEEIISRNELLQRVDFKKFTYFRFDEDEYVFMEIKTPSNEMPCTLEIKYDCRALAGFRTHDMRIVDIVAVLNCFLDADEFSVVNLEKQSDCPRTEPTDYDTPECNSEPNPEYENGPGEQEQSAPSCNSSCNDSEDNSGESIDVAEALIAATIEAWQKLQSQREYCVKVGRDFYQDRLADMLRGRWGSLRDLVRTLKLDREYVLAKIKAQKEEEGNK